MEQNHNWSSKQEQELEVKIYFGSLFLDKIRITLTDRGRNIRYNKINIKTASYKSILSDLPAKLEIGPGSSYNQLCNIDLFVDPISIRSVFITIVGPSHMSATVNNASSINHFCLENEIVSGLCDRTQPIFYSKFSFKATKKR